MRICTIGGTKYREFSLDANDTGSDDYMSIDEFKVFLDNQSDLHQYNDTTESFGTDDSTKASKIFQAPNVILMRSDPGQPAGVKIIDFGIARQKSAEDTVTLSEPGTPSFMAPELFEGAPADPNGITRSDTAIAAGTVAGRKASGTYENTYVETDSTVAVNVRFRIDGEIAVAFQMIMVCHDGRKYGIDKISFLLFI